MSYVNASILSTHGLTSNHSKTLLTSSSPSLQITHENEELNQHLSASRESQLKLKSEARLFQLLCKNMPIWSWILLQSYLSLVDAAHASVFTSLKHTSVSYVNICTVSLPSFMESYCGHLPNHNVQESKKNTESYFQLKKNIELMKLY